MPERIHAPHVGSMDPELKNSPVLEWTDEDSVEMAQTLPEHGMCYFNGRVFGEGDFVCSGDELLQCERGAWVNQGSCDPDNP